MSEENILMRTEKIDFCKSLKAQLFKKPMKITFSRQAEIKGELFGKTDAGYIVFIDKQAFVVSPDMILAASFDVLYKGKFHII